jgi:hypothetical protein
MGGNRNMDELIKRKLDDLEIEPSQLTFNKVHKAYLAQKSGDKAGNNLYWLLYMACAVLVLTLLGYLLMNPAVSGTKDVKEVAVSEQTKLQEISSNESKSQEGITEAHTTSNSVLSPSDKGVNALAASNSKETTSVSSGINETLPADNNTARKEVEKNTAIHGNSSKPAQSNATSSGEVSSVAHLEVFFKANGAKGTKSSRLSKKETDVSNNDNSVVVSTASNKRHSDSRNGKGESKNSSTNTDRNLTLQNTQVPMVLNNSSQSIETADYLIPRSGFLFDEFRNRELVAMSANDSLARLDLYKDYYKKRISPYYFTFGSEIQLNAIDQNVVANSTYNVKVDLPQFNDKSYNAVLSESIHSSTQYNFGGSFLLGFHNQNWGIESGIRFFGFENTTYLKHLPSTYYKRQFESVIFDTLGNTYDSLYTTTSIKYPFVVNGDTVSATKYLNTYRFIAIPLRLNYTFRLMKTKFLLEPSLGAQFCLPMASTNLVYDEKPYQFVYEKSTRQLAPFVQLDGGIKLQYQLSRSAGIYIRQGYSFGKQSIYQPKYPVKLDFSTLYTGVGICVTLRKY